MWILSKPCGIFLRPALWKCETRQIYHHSALCAIWKNTFLASELTHFSARVRGLFSNILSSDLISWPVLECQGSSQTCWKSQWRSWGYVRWKRTWFCSHLTNIHSFIVSLVLFFAAGAGKRHDASEETTGWARSHEAALPSNGGEGGGPTGPTGAGQHQERAQQVMVMIKFNRLGVSFCYVAALISTSATAKWSQKSARPTQSFQI